MNNKRIYDFKYNLPADNHFNGKTDVFIDAHAEWNKGHFYEGTQRPVVIFDGPVTSSITKTLLFVVIDWHKVFDEIERLAEEYFADTFVIEPKSCVEIAEEILR